MSMLRGSEDTSEITATSAYSRDGGRKQRIQDAIDGRGTGDMMSNAAAKRP